MADIFQIVENNGIPKDIGDSKARTNIAPTFDVNKANAVGDLVLSDSGILYRFNAAYSAGTSWNNRTSKEQVNLAEVKAPLNSPTFTGTPIAPTATAGTNNTQIATTAYADTSSTNAIAPIKSDIGIVEDTNTATHSISAGQYVIWKGNLYIANTAIANGAALSTSNLTQVTNGGLNDINNNLHNHAISLYNSIYISANSDLNNFKTYGNYRIESNAISETIANIPVKVAGVLIVKSGMNISTIYIQQIFIPYTGARMYTRYSNSSGNTWFYWNLIGEEDGWWQIDIPRATLTNIANNRWHRQGNVVFCEIMFTVDASQTGNAYIAGTCIPNFGLTVGNVYGTWHDKDADKSGTVCGTSGGNIWMALNGNGPAPLTNFVGHIMGISLTVLLH